MGCIGESENKGSHFTGMRKDSKQAMTTALSIFNIL